MKLTGKCKEAFLEFYWTNYIGRTRFLEQKSETEEFFNSLYPTLQQALIIEFFDTKQYYGKPLFESCFEIYWKYKTPFHSFNDVCIQAIEKANTIYNEN